MKQLGERSKLLEEVELEWKEREKRMMERDEDAEKEEGSDNESDTDERDECITKVSWKFIHSRNFAKLSFNTVTLNVFKTKFIYKMKDLAKWLDLQRSPIWTHFNKKFAILNKIYNWEFL